MTRRNFFSATFGALLASAAAVVGAKMPKGAKFATLKGVVGYKTGSFTIKELETIYPASPPSIYIPSYEDEEAWDERKVYNPGDIVTASDGKLYRSEGMSIRRDPIVIDRDDDGDDKHWSCVTDRPWKVNKTIDLFNEYVAAYATHIRFSKLTYTNYFTNETTPAFWTDANNYSVDYMVNDERLSFLRSEFETLPFSPESTKGNVVWITPVLDAYMVKKGVEMSPYYSANFAVEVTPGGSARVVMDPIKGIQYGLTE